MCRQSTFQEGLAALSACEVQAPAVMVENVRGLKHYFGITDEASLRFFKVRSVLDEDHCERKREGILKHTSPVFEPSGEVALQRALDRWWGFLDGVMDPRSSSAGNQTLADRWAMLSHSRLALPLALF